MVPEKGQHNAGGPGESSKKKRPFRNAPGNGTVWGGTLFHMEKEVIVERDQAAHMCSGERTGWRISILQAEYQLVPSWLLKYALAIS